MSRHVSGVVAALVACGVLVHAALAGAADLSGMVRSRDGARLPYASVVVRSADTGAEWRTVSSDLGSFRVTGLPAGTFEVRVEAQGFQPLVTPGVTLGEHDALTMEPVLEVETVREALTVLGRAPSDTVEAAALRDTGARDVGEALAATVGVWQLRKGGIANEVVVRGLQSRDVNVLVDGQRVDGACPNHMDPPAFHVDFAEVDRIELGKGPFDVRHFGSLGGVVNVVTRRPERGWHGTATLGLGSRSYANPSVVASYGGPTWFALGGGSYRRGDPYEDGRGASLLTVANYAAPSRGRAAFEVGSGWARVVAAPSGSGQLQASYARQQADNVLYPYLQMDAIFDDTDRATVSAGRSGGRLVQTVQARASYARVRHWMTDGFRATAGTARRGYSMGTDATTEVWGGRLDATLADVSTGVEAVRRSWDTRTELAMRAYAPQASIPSAETVTAGVFADWRRALGARATLEAGARLDHVTSRADAGLANTGLYWAYHRTRATSRRDVLPGGRVRLSWQAGAWRIGGAVGHAARVAEGNERFFALQRVGTDWVGNPTLSPARNTGVEAVLGWSASGAAVQAQVFADRVHGYIGVYDQTRLERVPGVGNASARTYANVDATLAGTEITASVPIASRVFVSGDVSHVRGSQQARPELGIRGTALAEMPAVRGRARLRFDDGRWFGLVEEVVTGDQRRVDVDLGETPTAGAAVTNLSGGVRLRRVSIAVGVTNLFDRYYLDALSYQRDPFRTGARVPEPGRQWFTTVTWRR